MRMVQPFIVSEPIYTFINTLGATRRKIIFHYENSDFLWLLYEHEPAYARIKLNLIMVVDVTH